jgi:hypothetical protein
MLKKSVFTFVFAVLYAAILQAQNLPFSINESFTTWVPDNDSWVAGGSGIYLTRENKTALIDTGLGDMSKYRYMSLGPAGSMDGDFEAEVDFVLRRQDQWNSFSLNVSALDGSWSVSIARKQKNPGVYLLTTQVTQQGKTQEKETAEPIDAGIFKISRTGNKLQLSWKPKNGLWKNLIGAAPAGQGSVSASIYAASAVSTKSIIQLNRYTQSWQKEVPGHLFPAYGNPRQIAKVFLLGVENTDTKREPLTIKPGGRAIYAVAAPINGRNLSLVWNSRGAVKVHVNQPGSAETIELGDSLYWDTRPDSNTKVSSHSIALEEFVTRRAGSRDWPYNFHTSDNIFFISFEPSLDQAVQLDSVKLFGATILPVKAFKPAYETAAKPVPEGNKITLQWKQPSGNQKWWGYERLGAGKSTTLAGIPFKVSPIVLDRQCSSAGIRIGEKAGLLHFAHAAGPGAASKSDWKATYLIHYDDGSTEPVFCTLRWNCGTYDVDWMAGVGPDAARLSADTTWWGPTGFPQGTIHYLPDPGYRYNVSWKGVYVTTIRNPYPEKTIKEILFYIPNPNLSFALVGISLTPPREASIGLVEPTMAAFDPDKPLRADAYIWRMSNETQASECSLVARKPGTQVQISTKPIQIQDHFAFASFTFTPAEIKMEPGPVKLVCSQGSTDLAASSLLGWMPGHVPGEKPFYMTMTAGGFESRWEFERMRRLGYDAILLQMGWISKPEEFDRWKVQFREIRDEGLAIAVRNLIGEIPPWKDPKDFLSFTTATNKQIDFNHISFVDRANPEFVKLVTDYYRRIADFVKDYPDVISINANYGLRQLGGYDRNILYGPKYQMPAFHQWLRSRYPLGDIEKETGLKFASIDAITAQDILRDKSNFLFTLHLHHHAYLGDQLQRSVNRAIREAGFKGNLVYNTPGHNQCHVVSGQSFDVYLPIDKDLGPSSPHHESSDRYSLSFYKWLSAKRTFNLQYGDEGCQTPPTYEHNIRAYQWMLMMQCREAIYCQWYKGCPAAQNIAWIKPFHAMLYNAEYIPDPVVLAFSYESGYREGRNYINEKDENLIIRTHYGLANTLRAININADKYIFDSFPKMDSNAQGRILIDDVSRYMRPEFADRLEKFMREGGSLVVTPDTDILHDHAFFKRFGIRLTRLPWQTPMDVGFYKTTYTGDKYRIAGKDLLSLATWSDGTLAAAYKSVGKGNLIILGKTWDQNDYDLNIHESYLRFCKKILCRFGKFTPNVQTDVVNFNATPYRAKDGSILVNVFNNTIVEKEVRVTIRKSLLQNIPNTRAYDYGSGNALALKDSGETFIVTTRLEPLGTTVIKFK